MQKILLVLSVVFLGMLQACSDHQTNIPKIWNMSDTQVMQKFLNSEVEHKGYYGMELRPEIKKAFVQFMYDPKVYELKLRKIKENNFQLTYQGKSREFKLREDNGIPSYLNFEDSKPYDPELRWRRDGNEESGYNTLFSFVQSLEKEYEFSEKEQSLQMDASEVQSSTMAVRK